MAKYTVHAGHAAYGNKYSGAVGYCAESVVDRAICKSVISWLQKAGHQAYDCTVDSGLSQGNIITKSKKKINSYSNIECNISIHLNAAAKSKADGKVKGCETLVYSTVSNDSVIANRICLELKALGFTNRGVKARTNLGVLKGIKNGGKNVLVECFFCDDQDDFNLFAKVGVDEIGRAIAMGILGRAIPRGGCIKVEIALPVLKKGSYSLEVKKLQQALNVIINANLVEDGKFGSATELAVKRWQQVEGLTVDGIYGLASYRKMQRYT